MSHERGPRRALQRALERYSAQPWIIEQRRARRPRSAMPRLRRTRPFRFTDKGYGRWFCRGCGMGGDGLRLVQTIKRVDFQTAASLVETVVGKVDAEIGAAGRRTKPSRQIR